MINFHILFSISSTNISKSITGKKPLGSATLTQKIKVNPFCYSFVHMSTDLNQSILQHNYYKNLKLVFGKNRG